MCRATPRIANANRASALAWGLSLSTLLLHGCGTSTSPLLELLFGSSIAVEMDTTINGDVASVAPDTGLPLTLSGTLSQQFEGFYDENILEVYFDENGAPIAAVSRSLFTIESPEEGTITSVNLIVIVDTLLSTNGDGEPVLDDDGNTIPIGLATASTGDIISGTGAYEGARGTLRSDSTILFGGGDFGFGTLEAGVALTLER